MGEEEAQEVYACLRGKELCQHSRPPFVELYTTTVLPLSTLFSKKIHNRASISPVTGDIAPSLPTRECGDRSRNASRPAKPGNSTRIHRLVCKPSRSAMRPD